MNDEVEGTSHPVEKGVDMTSTIRKKPIELSISGKIVDVNGMSAADILAKLRKLQANGSLINYSGRCVASNLQIQSFPKTHVNTNTGGADFSMTLKEIRIAKSAYNPTSSSKKTVKKNNPDLSVGATVVFKGGYVYVSSDAKKPAAKRSRSTCKITIINSRSWSIHSYHLISTDGKMVYGWVDKADIEGVASDSTAATSNGGTQQTQKGTGTAVYHTVKKGDTVYELVHVTYKQYNITVKELMANNEHAFSQKGNMNTLKVGAKLLITKNK